MKSFAVKTRINATPDAVWALLTDASGYPSWNTTVTRVDGRIAPSETLTIHVAAAPGRSFPVKVVTFDQPTRLVWTGGMALGLFTGARTYELVAVASGGVEFSMVETYTGFLAPLITKSLPNLQPAFDEFAACLKVRAERL